MKKDKVTGIVFLFFFMALGMITFVKPASSADFCVSNSPDLQTALNTAASNGEDDTIQIVQGTYNGNFFYATTEANSLTLEGGYTGGCSSRVVDPANTVLDGGGIDHVLALVKQEGAADFSVDGLTLQNGNASTANNGGGLHTRTTGHITLINNSFSRNTADGDGGGAYIAATGTLTNNTFSGNSASGSGGGVYIAGVGTLTNNTFTGNSISVDPWHPTYGGGAFIGSTGTLTKNAFTGNTGSYGGAYISGTGTLTDNTFTDNTGGVYIAGTGILTNNTFTNNTGGGAYIVGKGTLTDNIFAGNSGRGYGGGAFVEGGATLTNNTFSGNSVDYGSGGGVYIAGVSTLTNNTFTDNTANEYGGGAFARGTITGNTFSGNTSNRYGGGALVVGTITGNTFSGNSASAVGGGAYIGDGSTVTNNTFSRNTARQGGGGAWVRSDSTDSPLSTLTNNTFTDNAVTEYGGGGGVAFLGLNGTLTNNTFTGNTANGDGGGANVRDYDGTTTLTNNIFVGNTGDNGGGIHTSGKTPILTNNTFSGNTAENQGGGIWIGFSDNESTGELYNNIIWNNSGSVGADLYVKNIGTDPFFPLPVELFNNDFDQSTSGTYITKPFSIDSSNIDSDPLFIGSGDYHLTTSSPCINTGDNNAPNLPPTDKDGNPRIVGGTVDMGAYESGSCAYVSKETTCGGNIPCYMTINDALSSALNGSLIKIGKGTYNETPTWSKTGTVTISGGWNDAFTQQTGTTEMYAPKATATGGGAVKVQPNVKVIPAP